MERAYFDRFHLDMTLEEAQSASHAGQCDEDVLGLLGRPEIAAQLEAIGPELIRAELREYGAWDDEELADADENRARIVWIAAGNIAEAEAFAYELFPSGRTPDGDCLIDVHWPSIAADIREMARD